MTEILHELGTIARALDSISNVEFKDLKTLQGTISLLGQDLRTAWDHLRRVG